MTARVITPCEAQQVRDASNLARCCAACGHPESPRNPLVLAQGGYRVHVSHIFDPDSGLYGAAFAECRPLAQIAESALLADCGYGGCWAESGEPCKAAEGDVHLARFGRAERKGLISAADMAVVRAAAGPGAMPGTVVPAGEMAGAAS
jgi:hypothetical protein